MGAGQSSNANSGERAAQASEVKTSYYDLLGIQRHATEDEIKKAYRKKALELHPDRNYGNVDNATKLFAEVQTAHEVLSDPQERAWYDSHESAILRGDDPSNQEQHFEHNVKVTTADDLARMTRKFNSAVDFTDAPSGFFGYLRETFDQLAKEEQVAAHWEDVDVPDYPSFGHKDDEYDDVVKPFYAVWMGFATRKTFAWKDQFRLSEAPDRRYRRAMEKENQKLRDEGIREFNDAVRSLAAFVRKRDPRYTPNTQSEAERQKILRDAALAQAARARAANESKLQQEVPDWAKVVARDENEGEIEDSESEEEHYECVACRKTFKSEKQWDAHEKSKKHQKAIHALRKKMEKENKHLNLDSDFSSSGIDTPASDEDVELQDGDHVPIDEPEHVADNDGPDEEQLLRLSVDDDQAEPMEKEERQKHEDERSTTHTKQSHEDLASATEESDGDDDYAPSEAVRNRLHSSIPRARSPQNPQSAEDKSNDERVEAQQPKMGKAAQKRAKKAAAAAGVQSDDNGFSCATCNAGFPSKTRLHQHIKDFKHAALKQGTSSGGNVKGKKGKH